MSKTEKPLTYLNHSLESKLLFHDPNLSGVSSDMKASRLINIQPARNGSKALGGRSVGRLGIGWNKILFFKESTLQSALMLEVLEFKGGHYAVMTLWSRPLLSSWFVLGSRNIEITPSWLLNWSALSKLWMKNNRARWLCAFLDFNQTVNQSDLD